MIRHVVIAAMLAALGTSVTASADGNVPLCVPLGSVVGVHIEVGDREVHVPAISDAHLCADVGPLSTGQPDVSLELRPQCGTPCFVLVIEDGEWTALSGYVAVYLTYEADGVPTRQNVVDQPIGVGAEVVQPVCLSMGNPIPECPEGSIAVPLPAP